MAERRLAAPSTPRRPRPRPPNPPRRTEQGPGARPGSEAGRGLDRARPGAHPAQSTGGYPGKSTYWKETAMRIQKLCVLTAAMLLALPAAVTAQQQPQPPQERGRGGPDWPVEPQALRHLQQQIEIGDLGPLPPIGLPGTARYLVTYMNSQTAGRVRSATVVTVTNQSPRA